MVRPSLAAIVSPAGIVLAFGFCAAPHTPLGNAAPGRAVSRTPLRSRGCASSAVMVIVRVESRVSAYIGPTPRPGAATVVVWRPAAVVTTNVSDGAVLTNVSRNSGTRRNGLSALPSGGVATPPELGAVDLPAVRPPSSTVAWTTWAAESPRRYFAANSSAFSARSAGLDCEPISNGMPTPHTEKCPCM